MRALLLFASSLLAGCNLALPPVADVCQDAVARDPEVRRLIAIGTGTPFFYAEHQDELRRARRRAELACLRARGLAPRGGVEAPRPPR